MSDESFATVKQLNDLEMKITTRQNEYEAKCEADRQALHGNDLSLAAKVDSLTAQMKEATSLIKPIADMFKGIFAHPKVQTALLGAVLAALGFVTYKLHNAIREPQPTTQSVQPIVIYADPPKHSDDAGLK